MALDPTPTPAAPRRFTWTAWQLRWGGFQLALLAVLTGCSVLFNSAMTSLLVTTSLGQKLVVQSAVLLVAGLGLGLGACLLLDLTFPGWQERHKGSATAVRWLLGGTQTVLFFLPALFVVLVGPSAIQIAQAMQGQ
jgi:hypothetical protein